MKSEPTKKDCINYLHGIAQYFRNMSSHHPESRMYFMYADVAEKARELLIGSEQKISKEETSDIKRWGDVFHYGFGYTVCPYCGDETAWYNPVDRSFQSDLDNNRREYCPKCKKRVFARECYICNQPPTKH